MIARSVTGYLPPGPRTSAVDILMLWVGSRLGLWLGQMSEVTITNVLYFGFPTRWISKGLFTAHERN